ncbi:ABC transporter ATP-binding protein [Paracoccus aestuariivivens]|uniref:ATP-binding cassette domain-containing protein n=1 Tax=Paracoccus aestuariivivens TaxID=1820333 RepID=A0A6L6JA93_9RHOB|nr:ATP-binding cassette domain-containing protein [Paracoccus aestuariivivens]MTH77587.1 ATP-binding cassette domain-containing protein [Paracoccus aestuariivivens]
MIRISDLSYRIGKATILRDISTELPKGALTALIGPNGAGKSTLLRLIGRLEPLQTGSVSLDGADLASTRTEDLALRMAVLGQQTAIASRLRLRELVGFGRWPHHRGRPCAKDSAIVDEALAGFALGDLADRFIDEISGGQAQRAYLAMTVAQDTDWLLLDEPLNNLDMAHARALMCRLAELVRGSGKSVVTVIHEVNYAAAWADHVVAMKDGRIVAQGTPHEVLTSETLSMLYDTPVTVGTHQDRPLILHHV